MVKELTKEDFNSEVLEGSGLKIVDFYADWCGPCRKLSPILQEIESEIQQNVTFTKINTDENLELAKTYQVSGLPTLLLFKDGNVVERLVGLMPKSSIITNIEKYL